MADFSAKHRFFVSLLISTLRENGSLREPFCLTVANLDPLLEKLLNLLNLTSERFKTESLQRGLLADIHNGSVFGKEKPVYDGKKPVFDDHKPAFDDEKPVFHQEKTVCDVEKPVFDPNRMVYVSEAFSKSPFLTSVDRDTTYVLPVTLLKMLGKYDMIQARGKTMNIRTARIPFHLHKKRLFFIFVFCVNGLDMICVVVHI